MFETSFLLSLKYFILNIIVPFIPWLLFLWIFYGQKFKWLLIYILSWFVWSWVIAFSLVNIQFIHYWIWVTEYFIISWILLALFIWKILIKKQSLKEYIQTLKIKNLIPELKKSFLDLPIVEKVFTIILLIFSLHFVFISGFSNFNFPSYGIDTFDNRNRPAYNIYMDEWIKLFGDENEILWRWRLWYPIHFAAYKALISQFVWWINDIYFNTRQRLLFIFWLLFIFLITFNKTKNVFKCILPIWLILSLPLVFFHSFEWYMDIPSIMYFIICAWLFYEYLENKDFDYLSLWLLFWFILSYIKNDWFVVYFPWLLMALFLTLCINKSLFSTIKWFIKDRNNLTKSIGYFVYFFIPFLVIKIVHWLWFNQAAYKKSWIWLSDTIHWEIFPKFYKVFFQRDNYNLILLPLLFIFIFWFFTKKQDNRKLFIYSWIIIFLIFVAVFLFAENYQWVLNQTIVNRAFTMVFVVLLWFSWFLLNEEKRWK